MAEFTGERVIPELVDADLFNEHFARYRFAGRFVHAAGNAARVLDAGCGSGYGTAELAGQASGAAVVGTDISGEAVALARQRYGAGVLFLQAACEALPFSESVFDLVVAFEVIEHLERWQELLTEAKRVLKPSGILLVSTPNRDYYAESRGASGPNPFHLHEFDYAEFRDALENVFPNIRIWTQNHAEAIVFAPEFGQTGVLESSHPGDSAGAHFFLAACSQSTIGEDKTFAWVPSTANILKEREDHITKLEGELAKKDAWLRQTINAHSELQASHEAVTAELVRQNNWAAELNREIEGQNARIDELQNELVTRLGWIGDLESQIGKAASQIARLNDEIVRLFDEIARRDREIARLNDEIESQCSEFTAEIARVGGEFDQYRRDATTEIERLQAEAATLEARVTERTLWAQRLDAELENCRAELARMQSSKWVRAGAKLGIGPGVQENRVRDGR